MRWFLFLFLLVVGLSLFFPKAASTPWGKKALVKVLQAKTGSQIEIGSVKFSWLGPQELRNVQIHGSSLNASSEELTIYAPLWKLKRMQGPFTVVNGRASLPNSVSVEQLNATIENGQFTAKGLTRQGGKSGSFVLEGSLPNYPSSFSLQGRLDTIPSALCDILFETETLFIDLFGDTFSLQGSIESEGKKGTLACSLTSDLCQTQINGSFNEKLFFLKDPLNISLSITPALSRRFFQDLSPLFLKTARSSHSALIQISPENFALPYAPFNLNTLSISQALVDLGQITIENGPSLKNLLQFLRSSRLQQTRTMEAWFAPFSFSLQNSRLKLSRLDLLLERSIHLCTWGKVNLSTQALDLYLGLPASTLSSSFLVPNLPRDYVLKIPIRGTISEPELVTGPALAEISALTISPKANKTFGKVLQAVIQVKNDKDIPPPKRPFPWE